MDALWFLSFLELPPEADERAIKRAYAVRLKRIDQEGGQEGFMRLRQAYEAALRWRAVQPRGMAIATGEPHSPVGDATPTFNPRVSLAPSAAPATGAVVLSPPAVPTDARVALERLVAALGTGVPAREALTEQQAYLRGCHLDASAQFERMLVDALAQGALPGRVALFDAACRDLGWMDVTRLAQLGPRGRWIASVLTEEPIWRQQASPAAGAYWFEWIEQGHHGEVPRELASQWPRVVRLLRQCPQQLRLRLSPGTLATWQAAFNALPALDRDLAETYAGPPSPAADRRSRPRMTESRRGASAWPILLGMVLVLNLIGAVARHPDSRAFVPPSAPASTVQRDRSGSALCSRIDAAMHMAGAPQPRDVQERRQLADVVRRCILTGQWRALPDPPLAALGISSP